jgi:hypothetical protein
MPARLSREDKRKRLVGKTRQRVDDSPETAISLHHSPKSRLGTLVREAGYEKIVPKMLEELEERLRDANVGTFPQLTDPSNNRLTRICFFDLANPVPGFQHPRVLFKEEKELSRFLWMNWAVLPYVKEAGLRIQGREVRLASDSVIDLLAEDKKTGELVGFELKAEEADDRVVGQAARYMQLLASRAAKEGRSGARLLIVTGQPDESLAKLVQQHAKESGVKTQWLLYRVTIDLTEAY